MEDIYACNKAERYLHHVMSCYITIRQTEANQLCQLECNGKAVQAIPAASYTKLSDYIESVRCQVEQVSTQ